MLSKRIITGSIVISLIIATLFVDWLCALLTTVFIIGGLYEFFRMLEKKGINTYKYFGIGIGTIIPLSLILRFELTKNWELLFVLVALLSLILLQFKRRENKGVVEDISTTIFGVLYVSWLLSFLIRIRYLDGGLGLLAAVLLMTKLGDIGAYFVGSYLGKTPLIPRISPKKSVEGSVGGLIFSVIGAFLSRPFLNLAYWHLVVLGITLGVLGQLGDLSESLIKRDCQVKDAGVAFPGMGGFLDLTDSLLFSAPTFYFYISAILGK